MQTSLELLAANGEVKLELVKFELDALPVYRLLWQSHDGWLTSGRLYTVAFSQQSATDALQLNAWEIIKDLRKKGYEPTYPDAKEYQLPQPRRTTTEAQSGGSPLPPPKVD